MERLTERHKYNRKDYISVDSKKYGMSCSNFCTNCGKADCDDIRKALFKLAEYEDLSEQGKLLKLPCAVGDTVYFPCEEFNFVFPVIISQIIISDSGEGRFCVQYNGCFFDGFGDPEKDFEFDMEDFGKTVFLTKAAAEEALQKMKETEG